MPSSSTIGKHLIPVYVLIVLAIQLSLVNSSLPLNKTNAYLNHICVKSEGKSMSKKYDIDVKDFVDWLIDGMPPEYGYGFHSGSGESGKVPIFAKVQCRGDILESECRSCLLNASSLIIKKCPNNRGRIIWFDKCLIDVSSTYSLDEIDYRHIFYLHNAKDVSSDPNLFNKNIKDFIYKLKNKTINQENIHYTREYMYATSEENLGKGKLYGMMQCTQALSVKNCSVCLDWIVKKLPKCCTNKQGGRVLSPSCNFRYELYPFVKT